MTIQEQAQLELQRAATAFAEAGVYASSRQEALDEVAEAKQSLVLKALAFAAVYDTAKQS